MLISKSLRVLRNKEARTFSCTLGDTQTCKLAVDQVLLESQYASLNYKDLQSCIGNPAITRKFPHTPGSDVSGIVLKSTSPTFTKGQYVYTCGSTLGTIRDGVFSSHLVVDAKDLSICPEMCSPIFCMSAGTSGLTAAIIAESIINYIAQNSLNQPRICIAGASTGVGLIVTQLLDPLTENLSLVCRDRDTIRKLSLTTEPSFIDTESLDKPSFPIQVPNYDIAVDLLGGNCCTNLLAQLDYGGILYSVGNILGSSLNASLLPFFERSITIKGVNAYGTSISNKQAAWDLLVRANAIKPLFNHLSNIEFSGLAEYISPIYEGHSVSTKVLITF